MRVVKGDSNGAVSLHNRKKGGPKWYMYLKGHVKEPYEMSIMALAPDRRSNFFYSLPAHLCAATCITEISFIVTLSNQSTLEI